MSQSTRPSYPQLEALVNFLEENLGIAKGHLRSAQGKWETKRKWEQITITLNAMGGTQKDAKDANRTGGGGPANLPSLTSIEERMVAILGGRGFAEGDSQFSVPILPSQEGPSNLEVSASTAPTPPVIVEQQDDHILLSLPAGNELHSPDHTPLLASTRSNRGRRSQIQVERDRLISIEERRVEAELIHARALQENMAALAAACNNIAEAITTIGTRVVNVLETLRRSP
ncbi:unnamed protein product [Diatraea saccharalis]|uniref:Regulatory protein zeste n=1 Tax=Diatraea saccharalis TaxID=40085 RepID=A0A9N9R6G9_9NEOP|nr:unnamed protein product [Diatraea saccharalis]